MLSDEKRFYEGEGRMLTAGQQTTQRNMVVLSKLCEPATVAEIVDVDLLLLVRQGQQTYSAYSEIESTSHVNRFLIFRSVRPIGYREYRVSDALLGLA